MKARTWYLRLTPREKTSDLQMAIDVAALMVQCEVAFGRHLDQMLMDAGDITERASSKTARRSEGPKLYPVKDSKGRFKDIRKMLAASKRKEKGK